MKLEEQQELSLRLLTELASVRTSKDKEVIKEFLHALVQIGMEIDNHLRILHDEFPKSTNDFFKNETKIPFIHYTDPAMNAESEQIIIEVELGKNAALKAENIARNTEDNGFRAIMTFYNAIKLIYSRDDNPHGEFWLKNLMPSAAEYRKLIIQKIDHITEDLNPENTDIWAEIIVDYLEILDRFRNSEFTENNYVAKKDLYKARDNILEKSQSRIQSKFKELKERPLKRKYPQGEPDWDKKPVEATRYLKDKEQLEAGKSLKGNDLLQQATRQGTKAYVSYALERYTKTDTPD